jgi:hypothetical protein
VVICLKDSPTNCPKAVISGLQRESTFGQRNTFSIGAPIETCRSRTLKNDLHKVACPVTMARDVFAPLLKEFLERFPDNRNRTLSFRLGSGTSRGRGRVLQIAGTKEFDKAC